MAADTIDEKFLCVLERIATALEKLAAGDNPDDGIPDLAEIPRAPRPPGRRWPSAR